VSDPATFIDFALTDLASCEVLTVSEPLAATCAFAAEEPLVAIAFSGFPALCLSGLVPRAVFDVLPF